MYTRDYREIMVPEVRVGRAMILPRNVYRISTYMGSNPITKTGEDSRWIFVIGKVGNEIHCIRLNDLKPIDFTSFLNKVREKRTPIKEDQQLDSLLKKFSKEGKDLFESYIKPNKALYPGGKSHYRIYKLEKIRYVWEIRFEPDFLRKIFGEINTPNTVTEMRAEIKEEVNEKDG